MTDYFLVLHFVIGNKFLDLAAVTPEKPTKEEEETKIDSETGPSPVSPPAEYVNPQGVRFKAALPSSESESDTPQRLVPYGLSWIRELFRFLVSLCNPLDKMNSEMMVHVGLTLVEVVMEVGVDALGRYASLLALVRDELCRNLFSVSTSPFLIRSGYRIVRGTLT